MVPFFGATAYENKAVYDKSSPINFIDNAKTPTLVVVGERDARVPRAAVVRVLARPAARRRDDAARRLSRTKATISCSPITCATSSNGRSNGWTPT